MYICLNIILQIIFSLGHCGADITEGRLDDVDLFAKEQK
jgi:hypothetical protein